MYCSKGTTINNMTTYINRLQMIEDFIGYIIHPEKLNDQVYKYLIANTLSNKSFKSKVVL